MGIVDKSSLRLNGETKVVESGKYRWEYKLGDIAVTLDKTRRVPCKVNAENGKIYVSGVSGRYQTGTRAWPASVIVDERGEFIHFGREESSGRCVKSMLFFSEAN